MPQVNITINKKSYSIACEEGKEAFITQLANKINTTIDQFRVNLPAATDNEFLVLAALSLANEIAEMDNNPLSNKLYKTDDKDPAKNPYLTQVSNKLELLVQKIETKMLKL